MRLLVVFLSLLISLSVAAPRKTDAQIKEQRTALKKLESDLAKKRKEIAQLENEEKGVLNTISLLDQNLNQTRIYINELSRSEELVQRELKRLARDIDSLDARINVRKEVMKRRIRTLYISGRGGEAKALYELMTQKENPERQAYWVHRVLYQDREEVKTLARMVDECDAMKKQRVSHLEDLSSMRSKKAVEEKGLVRQMNGQEQMLASLKHDKAMQRKALQEFERNQKTMLSLIKKLEEKRKKEIEEAKKIKKPKAKVKEKVRPKTEVAKPKVAPKTSVAGPKCMPLNGKIISQYGLQEHPVLHIATRNLGVEIRGKKGNPVRAAAAGTVVMVAEIDGRGPSVIIEHEGGTYSVYGHLRTIRVKEGKEVRNCEEIGEVGDIASLNGIKLYFQVSEGTQTVDPLLWLNSK